MIQINGITEKQELIQSKKNLEKTLQEQYEKEKCTQCHMIDVLRMASEINIESCQIEDSLTCPQNKLCKIQTIYEAIKDNSTCGLSSCYCQYGYPLDAILNTSFDPLKVTRTAKIVYIAQLSGIIGGGSILLKHIIKETLDIKKMDYIYLKVASSAADSMLIKYYEKVVAQCNKQIVNNPNFLYVY